MFPEKTRENIIVKSEIFISCIDLFYLKDHILFDYVCGFFFELSVWWFRVLFLQVRNLLVGVWKQESFKDEVCEMPVCGVFIFFVDWFLLELKHVKLGFDFRILWNGQHWNCRMINAANCMIEGFIFYMCCKSISEKKKGWNCDYWDYFIVSWIHFMLC